MRGLHSFLRRVYMSMPSTRPKVDEKVKTFGQNVAPRPLNPAENQLQLYPVTMEVDRVKAPRYVHVLCVSKCVQEIHRDVVVPVSNWPCTLSLLLPSTLLLPPSHSPSLSPSLFCFPCFRWSSLPPLLPLPLSALTAPSRCTSVEPRSVQMHHMPDLS